MLIRKISWAIRTRGRVDELTKYKELFRRGDSTKANQCGVGVTSESCHLCYSLHVYMSSRHAEQSMNGDLANVGLRSAKTIACLLFDKIKLHHHASVWTSCVSK